MKSLIQNLRNIFSIEDLRQRIIYTIILLAAFRFGSFVVLPGVNSTILSQEFSSSQGEGLLGLLNTFVGGAFARGSIFALGIMPYISASIIIQLLGAALPSIQKLQKEGESGQRKLNQYTRILTVFITIFQAFGTSMNLRFQYPNAITIQDSFTFTMMSIFVLASSTLFLVWLGERITEKGIGNGTSLIIAIGIISELPLALVNEARLNPLMIFYVEILALGLVTLAVVLLTQGVRQIPINYAKRMSGNKIMGGMMNTARDYIPLKLNTAGVMPIIFAQAIMFIPVSLAQFFPESAFWIYIGQSGTGVAYNITFAVLIVVFSYLYTAIAVNPIEIADTLKRNDGFIPNVKPGKKTAEFIDNVLSRITLPGAIFLAFIAIMPSIVTSFGVSNQFSQFFGGTSLLIMIGVVLDTLAQIDTFLANRHYDGLSKTGRIRGRGQVKINI